MSLFIQTCGARSFKSREDFNSSSSPRSPRSPGSPGKSGWRRARLMMSCTSAQRSDEDERSVIGQTTCAICLETLKAGQGQALFTAECSHTFHFHCIASNAQHGNLICPVCRANWKQVPWRAPADLTALNPARQASESSHTNYSRIQRSGAVRELQDFGNQRRPHNLLELVADEDVVPSQPRFLNDPRLGLNARAGRDPWLQEPSMFDDDEPLVTGNAVQETDGQVEGETTLRSTGVQEQVSPPHAQSEIPQETNTGQREAQSTSAEIYLHGYPEVDEVAAAETAEAFTVLVNVKAGLHNRNTPPANEAVGAEAHEPEAESDSLLDPNNRAPLDLVTVLDISSSMTGNKLRLLKCAMEFVINNLSPSDRLSVVAFSSSAKRLFPLRRMVEEGRQFALRYVNSLEADGGTNIADGLRKGAKVLEDRRMKNPVASIMLLSDGQDTYNMRFRSYSQFNPTSLRSAQGSQIPVHTFGFGEDHDAALMHSIAETSGGTFSFVQTESAVQDAFAQCIGGLLSVIVQNAEIKFLAGEHGVQIRSIQAGNYQSSIGDNGSQGGVKIGDLYAEEERDILVDVKLPAAPLPTTEESTDASGSLVTKLLRVSCSFQDPVTHDVNGTSVIDISIRRPEFVDTAAGTVRLEVDRQRNRTRVAQSIVEAQALADAGEITGAQLILSTAKAALLRSPAFQAHDQLCLGLERELAEIQTRMETHQTYQRSGRAYALSVTSSHLQQRSTTRGDHDDDSIHDHYRTSSMISMVARSQALTPISTAPAGLGQDSRGGRYSQRSGQRSAPLPRMPMVGESEGAQDASQN
ncbi:hypothetical protein R1sor_002329 [Riccia sorocarpa]|uniref:Zinc finger protein n=1 Tax=Riccia sorocarpa TaxID=122646 RepID=A0ABD3H1K5_9MARC